MKLAVIGTNYFSGCWRTQLARVKFRPWSATEVREPRPRSRWPATDIQCGLACRRVSVCVLAAPLGSRGGVNPLSLVGFQSRCPLDASSARHCLSSGAPRMESTLLVSPGKAQMFYFVSLSTWFFLLPILGIIGGCSRADVERLEGNYPLTHSLTDSVEGS